MQFGGSSPLFHVTQAILTNYATFARRNITIRILLIEVSTLEFMRVTLPFVSLTILLLWGCGQESKDNQALYDEVMKVHDEVMPKMNDIYKLREQLKKQIADTAGLVDEKKKAIESAILKLDSSSEGMMVWMRNFNPLPDSLGEEKARAYLEDQKVKVEKVKKDMLQAIEEAGALD